jgi:hypothetical protein
MKYPSWLCLLPLAVGCSLPVPTPPSAEFLVADAGSTFWVRSGPHGVTARNSPLILTSADNRFYEVYVGEVTRSYEDAIFTREPIYSRDLLTGRKKLLWEESKVAAWEKAYLTRNPDARLLEPDEEGSDDVSVAATSESDILAVVGPYVLYNRRVTLERGNFQASDSSKDAIDIRSGTSIALDALVKDTSILGAGAVREAESVRWRHSGYDVIARWDDDRGESEMVIRDMRGHEWTLGYVSTRLPRIFWLDQPRVDGKLRSALVNAFDDARSDEFETQLVMSRDREGVRPRRVAENRATRLISLNQ